MNTYRSLPACMDDVAGTDSLALKVLHTHPLNLGLQASSLPQWRHLFQSQPHAFAEAALSPAKYAMFQILGNVVFRAVGIIDASATIRTWIKIGSTGGAVLTIVYLLLLLARGVEEPDDITEDTSSGRLRGYASLLCEEIFYSTVAAVIGSLSIGIQTQQDLWLHAAASASGPLLFLFLLFTVAFAALGLLWAWRKVGDYRYRGY